MSEKEKLAEIQKLKESMVSKMNQAKLKGGLANNLIRGCCTQGCCDGDPRVDEKAGDILGD
jgi:hypothetical protein